jgi:hypothetical protein
VALRMWISKLSPRISGDLTRHVAHSSRCIVITKSAWTKIWYGLANNSVLELKALPRDTEVNSVAQGRHRTARWISMSRGKELPRRASCTNDLFQDFSIRKKAVENQVTCKQAMLQDGTAGPIPQAGFALEQNGIESRKGGHQISRLSLHSSPEYYYGTRNTNGTSSWVSTLGRYCARTR